MTNSKYIDKYKKMVPYKAAEALKAIDEKVDQMKEQLSAMNELKGAMATALVEVFQENKIERLVILGVTYYISSGWDFSTTGEDRLGFCKDPPKKLAEAKNFVEETVNARTFNAWLLKLKEAGHGLPKFVKEYAHSEVRMRKA